MSECVAVLTIMVFSVRRAFHTLGLLALGVMMRTSHTGASSLLTYRARPLCAPDHCGSGLALTALQAASTGSDSRKR